MSLIGIKNENSADYRLPDPEETRTALNSGGYLTDELLAQVGLFVDFNPKPPKGQTGNSAPKLRLYAPTSPSKESVSGGVPVNPPASLSKEVKWEVLAHGIPERSFGVAANTVPRMRDVAGGKKRNFNMERMRDKDASGEREWPLERVNGDTYGKDWKHVDFRHMPLNFVENTYQKILDITRPDKGQK